MPLLQIDRLTSLRERQRASVVLSIMAHSYIWGHGLDIAQVPIDNKKRSVKKAMQLDPSEVDILLIILSIVHSGTLGSTVAGHFRCPGCPTGSYLCIKRSLELETH